MQEAEEAGQRRKRGGNRQSGYVVHASCSANLHGTWNPHDNPCGGTGSPIFHSGTLDAGQGVGLRAPTSSLKFPPEGGISLPGIQGTSLSPSELR